jgi:hypothetical protein
VVACLSVLAHHSYAQIRSHNSEREVYFHHQQRSKRMSAVFLRRHDRLCLRTAFEDWCLWMKSKVSVDNVLMYKLLVVIARSSPRTLSKSFSQLNPSIVHLPSFALRRQRPRLHLGRYRVLAPSFQIHSPTCSCCTSSNVPGRDSHRSSGLAARGDHVSTQASRQYHRDEQ